MSNFIDDFIKTTTELPINGRNVFFVTKDAPNEVKFGNYRKQGEYPIFTQNRLKCPLCPIPLMYASFCENFDSHKVLSWCPM
jgi:hypothetical protein